MLEAESTRRSVREEIEASSRIATQLLTQISKAGEQQGAPALAETLQKVGRVRGNEVFLYGTDGRLLYSSPPSPYKAGRDAPDWFTRLVSPPLETKEINLASGRLLIQPQASRAVLDGWDELKLLFGIGVLLLLAANLIIFWAVGRALAPLGQVVDGLQHMERGAYHTRLPQLRGREAQLMSDAFNRMAQSIEDNVSAKHAAREATTRLADNRELSQMLQARIEEERRVIARELHDEMGQLVTAIKSFGLSIAQRAKGVDESIERSANYVVDTAGKIYGVMHTLIPRLRPLALDDLGLNDALGDLVADWRLQQPGIVFSLHVDGLPAAPGETLRISIYRIVQEAVNNAIRHAQSRHIAIDIKCEADDLLLRIEDDGHGLAQDWQQPGHYGVRGMKERAAMLGGQLELLDRPGQGVSVIARLPTQP